MAENSPKNSLKSAELSQNRNSASSVANALRSIEKIVAQAVVKTVVGSFFNARLGMRLDMIVRGTNSNQTTMMNGILMRRELRFARINPPKTGWKKLALMK